METSLYQINLKDGRVFKVFCENTSQKKRIFKVLKKIYTQVQLTLTLENGIHTIKQFEAITSKL